jgi:membrane protein DedA with SNARE-associated domain
VPHLRPPSISHGVIAFIWALVFFLFIWFGGRAVGVHSGTSFILGALVGFFVFLAVLVYGRHEPRRPARR